MVEVFMKHGTSHSAFTLIELLVVMGIFALLLAVLLPGLARARRQAKSALCRSNIRQLAIANDMYSQESDGFYCPGAANFLENLHRWHGLRDSIGEPFDPSGGPLAPYLGPQAAVRACPSFEPDIAGFEAGNGGYGYNNAFIGVQVIETSPGVYLVDDDRSGARAVSVKRPGATIMFTDAAFVSGQLIEYSFAEPRFHPQFGSRADPSIHFRHDKRTSVAFGDSHVEQKLRTFTWSSGLYQGDPERFDIGWFGKSDDNRLFDLK